MAPGLNMKDACTLKQWYLDCDSTAEFVQIFQIDFRTFLPLAIDSNLRYYLLLEISEDRFLQFYTSFVRPLCIQVYTCSFSKCSSSLSYLLFNDALCDRFPLPGDLVQIVHAALSFTSLFHFSENCWQHAWSGISTALCCQCLFGGRLFAFKCNAFDSCSKWHFNKRCILLYFPIRCYDQLHTAFVGKLTTQTAGYFFCAW